MWYIYFLCSIKNRRYYVGVTKKDPKLRLIEHNSGSNKWTRDNRPFRLIFYEKYQCKQDAYARERFYKSGFGRTIRNAIIKTTKLISGQ